MEHDTKRFLNMVLLPWLFVVLFSNFSFAGWDGWSYDWDIRTDGYGKPAGIYTITPFPIHETTGSYSITNDEGTKTFHLGAIYFVDGTEGCTNGATNYDPATRSCGSGSYTVYTTIGNALNAVSDGNKTILVRSGTYTETGRYMRTGADDTHRYMLTGYKQERPIWDGGGSNNTILNGPSGTPTNVFFTIQRMKMQNSAQEGMQWGGGVMSHKENYVYVIDVEFFECSSAPTPHDHSTGVDNGNVHVYGADYAWFYHVTSHKTYGHGFKIADGASHTTIEWSVAYDCGWWSGIPDTSYFNHHSMGFDFTNHGGQGHYSTDNILRYSIAHDTLMYNLNSTTSHNYAYHHNEFYNGWRCVDIMTDTYTDCYLKDSSYANVAMIGESSDYGNYGRFYGNVVRNCKGVSSDGQWELVLVYGNSDDHDLLIYNNLLYDSSTGADDGIWLANNLGNNNIHIYNNSIYLAKPVNSGTSVCIDDDFSGDVVVKNNILYHDGTGACMSGTPTIHTHNQYYFPNGSRGVTLSEGERDGDPSWQALPSGPFDPTVAKLTQPLLGTGLSAFFNTDINGKIRAVWNMGVHEYIRPQKLDLRIVE